MPAPVIRVSLLDVPPNRLAEVERIMVEVEAEPGLSAIRALPGHVAYFAGVDRAGSRLRA